MRIHTLGGAEEGNHGPPVWARGGSGGREAREARDARRAWQRLHTRPRLDAILHRERARADRTGLPLCLVVFKIGEGVAQARAWRRLARTILRRARITDDVGWYGSGSIAAVLPHTPAVGAWKFARDVAEALGRHAMSLDISVYSYPSGRPGTGQHSDSTEHNSKSAAPAHSPEHPPWAARELSPWGARYATWGAEHEARTLPLEPLFVRPVSRWKRTIDLVGAAAGLVIASPILVLAGLAVKLSSPGPVLFVQLRAGRGGRPFRMYKFRTMHVDAEQRKSELVRHSEQDGPAFKMRNDPRVTRIGRVLRKTSIDELPQLWNVLKGEMSLVGPRPLPCDEAEACNHWHRRRHDVLPGLTCIWQVQGRSGVSFDEWMRMDAAYIRGQGLVRDLLILLQTIPAVLLRRGAS